jgi:uncharacterized protein
MTTSAVPHSVSSTRRMVEAARAVRRETALAWVGLALIGVHVADDNFLQPQPGTSASDHLVSGFVPLALVLTAMAAYRLLRNGFRAAVAITFGAFGVVMGAGEPVYYSLKVGPSGDDYTGFLALAAGLLLIGVGVTTLWTTRRTDDRLHRRYLRRLLLATGAVVATYFLFFPVALSYVFTHRHEPSYPVPTWARPSSRLRSRAATA